MLVPLRRYIQGPRTRQREGQGQGEAKGEDQRGTPDQGWLGIRYQTQRLQLEYQLQQQRHQEEKTMCLLRPLWSFVC